jgi:hypothetical protein
MRIDLSTDGRQGVQFVELFWLSLQDIIFICSFFSLLYW